MFTSKFFYFFRRTQTNAATLEIKINVISKICKYVVVTLTGKEIANNEITLKGMRQEDQSTHKFGSPTVSIIDTSLNIKNSRTTFPPVTHSPSSKLLRPACPELLLPPSLIEITVSDPEDTCNGGTKDCRSLPPKYVAFEEAEVTFVSTTSQSPSKLANNNISAKLRNLRNYERKSAMVKSLVPFKMKQQSLAKILVPMMNTNSSSGVEENDSSWTQSEVIRNWCCFCSLFIIIPMFMVIIGFMNLENCPKEQQIPFFLITSGGISIILALLIAFIKVLCQTNRRRTHCLLLATAFCIILAIQIWGSFVVFPKWSAWHFDENMVVDSGCSKTIYLFAFSILVIYWVYWGLVSLVLIAVH